MNHRQKLPISEQVVKEINKYQRQLGIEKPVTIFYNEAGDLCRCFTTMDGYGVELTADVYHNWRQRKYYLVHELCHCFLCDIFGTKVFCEAVFHPKYADEKYSRDPIFYQAYQYLYLCWIFIDIWVDDLVEQKFPGVSIEEDQTNFKLIQQIESVYGFGRLSRINFNDVKFLTSIAMIFAGMYRQKIPCPEEKRLIEVVPLWSKNMVKRLTRVYKFLPPLDYNNREKSILEVEQYTNRIAGHLGISFRYKLEQVPGHDDYSWDYYIKTPISHLPK